MKATLINSGGNIFYLFFDENSSNISYLAIDIGINSVGPHVGNYASSHYLHDSSYKKITKDSDNFYKSMSLALFYINKKLEENLLILREC